MRHVACDSVPRSVSCSSVSCDEVLVACTESSIASVFIRNVQPGLSLLDLCADVGAYFSALLRFRIIPAINDNFLSCLVDTADVALQIVQLLL